MSGPENPPAFPSGWPEAGYEPGYGMTQRDWFAGQALAGLLANPVSFGAIMQGDPDAISRACGTFADAMLAERAKGGAK